MIPRMTLERMISWERIRADAGRKVAGPYRFVAEHHFPARARVGLEGQARRRVGDLNEHHHR
jgi:hypothetical protein